MVQIYSHSEASEKFERRLAGFAKVAIRAGESANINIALEPLAFKHFKNGWQDSTEKWIISLAENAFEQGSSIVV